MPWASPGTRTIWPSPCAASSPTAIPDFPSGLFYPRALPLSYLTAGLARLFGWSEVVLRSPSVVFSALAIVGVYLLGRRLTSPRVALLAALLMAVSAWEVELTVSALAGGFVLVSVWTAVRRTEDRLFPLILAAAVAALALQQLMLAAMVLAAYLLIGRRREPEVVLHRSLRLELLILAASVGWILFWLSTGPEAATAKELVKPLIGYPPLMPRALFAGYPLMSVLAAAACGVAAVRFWRSRRIDGLGLLALLLVVPTVGLGFHPEALQRASHARYVYFANPYFLLLVAFGALWIGERLWRLFSHRRPLRMAVAVLYSLGLLVMSDLASAQASLALVTAQYGVLHGESDFHPDHAGQSRFVRDRYEASDVVIAMDILAHYAYLPVAHYQLSLLGKPDAEAWIGTPSLTSARELSDALERHRGDRVWIVLAAQHLRRLEHDPEMEAILRILARQAGEPRYRGRDGLSDVYLVEPREPE